jgi:dUTP pyrophosphatase
MIALKIINRSKNEMPKYATQGSAGMDIRAHLETPIVLKPMERKLIPTGIYLEIPEGYEAQVRPRSGLAYKNGITVLNAPGTIDADYRGEVGVILINLSNEEFNIENGDRVAQLVFSKVEMVQLQVAESLSESDRGDGGFGHTGKG